MTKKLRKFLGMLVWGLFDAVIMLNPELEIRYI